MKVTVTKSLFAREFADLDRTKHWTPQGLAALFDHLDETRDENEELDVQQIDSEFAEYPSARKACDDNDIKYRIWYLDDDDKDEDEEETEMSALRRLRSRMKTVLELDNGGVIIEE